MELSRYDFRNIEFINRLSDEEFKEGTDYIRNHEDKLQRRDELFQKAERYSNIARWMVALFTIFLLIFSTRYFYSGEKRGLGIYLLFLGCYAVVLYQISRIGISELISGIYYAYKDFKVPTMYDRELYVAWKEKIEMERFLRDFYFGQHIVILDRWINIDGDMHNWFHLWCKYRLKRPENNKSVSSCMDIIKQVKNIRYSFERENICYDVITDTLYIPVDESGNIKIKER